MKNIFTVLLTFLYLTVSFADQTGTDTLTIGKKNSNNKKLQFNKSGTPAEIRWNNSSSKIQFSNDGSIFTDIGSGGSFGVNFLSANPDAETNSTTGWSVIQDTAQATPACSASPSAGTNTIASRAAGAFAGTYTTSSTAVLRGTYSFEYNKATATQIGEELQYAFTIAEADKSKPHQITFDVDTSTLYAASDMGVYVCDGTTLITPSIVNIPAGKSKFIANFNATTSGSYKLVLHVQSASSSIYNLKLDNFQVGPQQLAVGPVESDWADYTTTPIGFGTPTGTKYAWKRKGDTLYVRAKFSAGTVTATEARFPFPPGLTASTQHSDVSIAGVFNRNSTSAFPYYVLRESGLTYFTFARADGTNTGFAKLLGNALIGTGDTISFNAEVQIAEWAGSANVVNGPNVEYASSTTGTWDASATTANTVYGVQGAAISGTLTSFRTKVVRFQYAIQPTDKLTLQYKQTTGQKWVNASDSSYPGQVIGGSLSFGASIVAQSTSTDVQVTFSQYMGSGTSYNSLTGAVNWDSSLYDAWRVKKESGVAATALSEAVPGVSNGFLSFNGVKGFTDGSSATSGYVGEYVESVQTSGETTVTNQYKDLTSLVLTPGDWDLVMSAQADNASAAGIYGIIGISTTSGNSSSGLTIGDNAFETNIVQGASSTSIGGLSVFRRINISTSTTYYAKIFSTGGTARYKGKLFARRVR